MGQGVTMLTDKQRLIVDYIVSFSLAQGYPPTRKEIADHFGFKSSNAAEEHLRAIARKGVIEIVPNTSRGIRVLTVPPISTGRVITFA